jgi:1-acyl-sn-glycerol-3-phosphate acyltransferase
VKPGYWAGWIAARFILKQVLGVRWTGVEKVPLQGSLILAPNHRSYLDPPIVGCGLRRELFFFAKAELFRIPVLGRVIRVFNSIPVKRGRADRASLATAIAAVRGGGGLVLFPEGTRSRGPGFLAPKLGVGLIRAQTGAPIIPVYISGCGGGRRRLLLSALRRQPIRVAYGDPISIEPGKEGGGHADEYQRIADQVMDELARLKERMENPPPR